MSNTVHTHVRCIAASVRLMQRMVRFAVGWWVESHAANEYYCAIVCTCCATVPLMTHDAGNGIQFCQQ
jgi:hypothetical protein